MDMVMLIAAVLCGTGALAFVALSVRGSRQDEEIRQTRTALATPRTDNAVFSVDMVADLPVPVQRYFRYAIAPGTPLASLVELDMTGMIKLGTTWHPFEAEQVIVPSRGFVWQPVVRMGAMTVRGADYYIGQSGATRFNLFGLIPIVNASGPETTKSALGRLAIESIWLPASLLPLRSVTWEALDDAHIRATMTVHGEPVTLRLTIDEAGHVTEVTMQRWNTDEKAYIPFGATVLEEQTFGGYTIPARLNIGWWYGSERYQDGEFFRCTINQARFR